MGGLVKYLFGIFANLISGKRVKRYPVCSSVLLGLVNYPSVTGL